MADLPVWIDTAPEANLAFVRGDDVPAVLGRLGTVEERGALTFAQALDLQDPEGSGAVVQAEARDGWVLWLEPNGFQASVALAALAGDADAASLFWNVNTATELRWRRGGEEHAFDPTIEPEDAPADGRELPWADSPKGAALAWLAGWTGVTLDAAWFDGPKPTFLITPG